MEQAQLASQLVVDFEGSFRVASHAVIGGGLTRSRSVTILGVGAAELGPDTDAEQYIRARIPLGSVGMATSRSLDTHVVVERPGVLCVATVGLSNRLRVGDPPAVVDGGTINLVLRLEEPLGEPALLEAMTVAAEARTLAVREACLPSIASGEPASGTGTDCIAVACPDGANPARFVGLHTDLGSRIGGAVLEAVRRGTRDWLESKGG